MADAPSPHFLDDSGEIFLLILSVLILTFSLVSSIVLIYSSHRDHIEKKKKTKNGTVNVAVYPMATAALLYLLSSAVFMAATLHFDVNREDNLVDDDALVLLTILFVFFLMAARLSIYSQFLLRLHFAFKGSMFELSGRTMAAAVGLMSLLFVAIIGQNPSIRTFPRQSGCL